MTAEDGQFQDKFIAFVDVLGFSELVTRAECGAGADVNTILKLIDGLRWEREILGFREYGPTVCPESEMLSCDAGLRVLQVSDSVIVSSEVSPSGVISIVHFCHGLVIRALKASALCRGYITRGSVYHEGDIVFGSGYERAWKKEGMSTFLADGNVQKGTPFVEIDPAICRYVGDVSDRCVKDMFGRLTETDGNSTAIYPFHTFDRIAESGIGSHSGSMSEKRHIDEVDNMISTFEQMILDQKKFANRRGLALIEHFCQEFSKAHERMRRAKEMIDRLDLPYPG